MKLLPPLIALLLAGAVQAQTYTVMCAKVSCGRLFVNETATRMETDRRYRNNGRGPVQKEVLEFAPDGAWLSYRTEGVSTYGARIAESFELKDDRAIRRIALVIKGGQALSPSALYQTMGILPFVPSAEIIK
jgi:hypothetical protein